MNSSYFSPTSDAFAACHALASATLPAHRLQALLTAAEGDPVHALTRGDGLTPRQKERLAEARAAPISSRLREFALEKEVRALLLGSPDYPRLLAPLDDAPPILFVRGTFPEATGVALVGSRRATVYGRGQAERFARALAEAGLVVVSGGAAGIDTAAHRGAVEVGGVSVAVVASGLDTSYPVENRNLFDRLAAEGGAVVSEYPLGTTPEPWRFPARNRIIAGMCPLTLVIEAPEASGALITARNAAEYGREVFVVPGAVDTGNSRGCHRLIQDGAALADGPQDVLDALSSVPRSEALPVAPVPDLPEGEAALYARFSRAPIHLDEAAELSGLSSPQAAVAATMLEMKGLIRREPGGFFIRA